MGKCIIKLSSGLLLLIFSLSTSFARPSTSEVYYITPSGDSQCTKQSPCITLGQLNVSQTLNLSLILLPGNHTLISELTITKTESFMMYSASSTNVATITCDPSAKFTFIGISTVQLKNIQLLSCGGNRVEKVTRFLLVSSILRGGGNSTTPLILNETSAEIISSQFMGNTIGTNITYSTDDLVNGGVDQVQVTVGGAIFAIRSRVMVLDTTFDGNAADNGGVIYAESNSTILINNSTFVNNRGTVIYTNDSRINDSNSVYKNNWATVGAVVYSTFGHASFSESKFYENEAEIKGSVFFSYGSNLSLSKCDASYNSASNGGVLFLMFGTLEVRESIFHQNKASNKSGVMNVENCELVIESSSFSFNSANALGIIRLAGTNLNLTNTTIRNNSVNVKGVLHAQDSFIQSKGRLDISDNIGNLSVVYFARCNATFHDGLSFERNSASFMVIDSVINIRGADTSFKHNGDKLRLTFTLTEGGAVTSIRSKLNINGNTLFENNHCNSNGGAIHAAESVVNLYAKTVRVVFNQAEVSGGGIFLYRSLLVCRGRCDIGSNEVGETGTGGGIHAISSSIMIAEGTEETESRTAVFDRKNSLISVERYYNENELLIVNNTAGKGGGVCLQAYSKIYLLGRFTCTNFTSNNAQYGGAIFVNDSSIGTVCDSDGQSISDVRTECFILKPYHNKDGYINVSVSNSTALLFEDNKANISGSILYGGLLDRCTLSPLSEVYYKQYVDEQSITDVITGVDYFKSLSKTRVEDEDISSDPIRICFCDKSGYNCSYRPPTYKVRKGEIFQVNIVAVDQVNQSVSATIHSSVSSAGNIMERSQHKRYMDGIDCKELAYNINSTNDSETLYIYAEGPCNSRGISLSTVEIEFTCECPAGFQKKQYCDCECDPLLKPHLAQCFVDLNGTQIRRKHNVWIGYYQQYYNHSQYFVYENCPFDYCLLPKENENENINLSLLNGSDSQCAFNRSGLLCSSCQPGLTLSIGSARCIQCNKLWYAVLVAVIVYELVFGVILVVSIWILDLTVASGTINGVLFYANVLASSQHIFLNYPHPNFQTFFVNLLNVTIGFDACIIKDMDMLTRTWLGMLFPIYGFILVFLIVKLSKCSRFATLLGKGNPVATLATLMLLFYTKLLKNLIKIFSFALINFPGGHYIVVWRPDANVTYFKGAHIPLFLAGVVILVVGLLYTFILLSWQWLLRASNKWPKIFWLIRNTKITLFMEANLAPYKPKYRFWTGLLLLVRIILHLVPSDSVNLSNNPLLKLLAGGLCVTLLILIRAYIGDTIYKRAYLDYLELTYFFNFLLLTIMTAYLQPKYWESVSTTSISIAAAMFMLILAFHVVGACKRTRCGQRIKMFIKRRRERNRHLVSIENNDYRLSLLSPQQETEISVEVTSSVVSMSPQHERINCDSVSSTILTSTQL